jgi:hypothetical protein
MSMFLLPYPALSNDDRNDDERGTFDFTGHLSGEQEVTPPSAPSTPSLGVSTDTSGTILVRVSKDLSSLQFRLVVRNGADVTQAHLHCGRAGQNGPVVVFLAPLTEQGRDVDGLLAQGTRRNEDIEPGAEACEALIGRPVRNIASLAAAAFEGLVYANVHTTNNPAGEVRAQLIPGHSDGEEKGDDD